MLPAELFEFMMRVLAFAVETFSVVADIADEIPL